MSERDDEDQELDSDRSDPIRRDEARLVDRVLAGNREAESELFFFIGSLIPPEVEEILLSAKFVVVNRVLEDLLLDNREGLRRWNRRFPLTAYLRTLIERRVADYAREKWGRRGTRRHDQLRIGNPSDSHPHARSPVDLRPGPDEMLWREEFRADYERVKARLSPDHQAVWVLRHEECLSNAEIAETLGRTVKSVEGLLSRAKEEFRRIAEEIAPHILPE
jgi:RNA polymerase sigma factor (sigma-70 family)